MSQHNSNTYIKDGIVKSFPWFYYIYQDLVMYGNILNGCSGWLISLFLLAVALKNEMGLFQQNGAKHEFWMRKEEKTDLTGSFSGVFLVQYKNCIGWGASMNKVLNVKAFRS